MSPALRFAVVGYPIAHSRSPEIHAAFARQLGISLQYERLAATPDVFEERVAEFFATGGRGLNVTLPHKLAAFAMCQTLSQTALIAGAVNTLSSEGGQLHGDNTDAIGLARDLQRLALAQGAALQGQRVLLVGAGGAARGAVAGLIDLGLSQIAVAARDITRAQALVDQFPRAAQVEALAPEAHDARFDVVINATAAGLAGEVPQLNDAWCEGAWLAYDLSYGQDINATPFLRHLGALGVTHAADGLGMLVEQAAESFYLWHGVRPDSRAVLTALRH